MDATMSSIALEAAGEVAEVLVEVDLLPVLEHLETLTGLGMVLLGVIIGAAAAVILAVMSK